MWTGVQQQQQQRWCAANSCDSQTSVRRTCVVSDLQATCTCIHVVHECVDCCMQHIQRHCSQCADIVASQQSAGRQALLLTTAVSFYRGYLCLVTSCERGRGGAGSCWPVDERCWWQCCSAAVVCHHAAAWCWSLWWSCRPPGVWSPPGSSRGCAATSTSTTDRSQSLTTRPPCTTSHLLLLLLLLLVMMMRRRRRRSGDHLTTQSSCGNWWTCDELLQSSGVGRQLMPTEDCR